MSVSDPQERSSPARSSPGKKTVTKTLNPLKFLRVKSKNNYLGRYDYFSDDDSLHSDSFEDMPLGIHGGNGWSYSFSSDDDNDDELLQSPSPPSSHGRIFFHATFDDEKHKEEDATLMPKPCTRVRHLSGFQPTDGSIRPNSPLSYDYASNYVSSQKESQMTARAYEADSDTSGTVDTDEDYDDPTYTLPKKRMIRFADECGKDLKTVHITERDMNDADEHLHHMRMIVLLLNPKKKQFEFLHLTTPREERTHILHAVRLFPALASDSTFGKQKYVGLCRAMKEGQEELINFLCLQDYDIDRDEILVAIPDGMKGKQICNISMPLLKDRNVQKMVKRKMRSGFAVQSLPYAMEQHSGRESHERDEKTPEESEATKETRQKKDETKQVDKDVDHADDSPIETRPTSGKKEETSGCVDEGRSEEVTTEADNESIIDEASPEVSVDDAHVETQSKTDQADEASTSTSSITATSSGSGIIAVQDETESEEKAQDTGEMKEFSDFLDELQRDFENEIKALMSNENKNRAADGWDNDDVDTPFSWGVYDDDVGAMFLPVESALDDALDEFRVSAEDTEDSIDDTIPDYLNVSLEANQNVVSLGSEESPLSLTEAIQSVFPPERVSSEKNTEKGVESVDDSVPSGAACSNNDDLDADVIGTLIPSSAGEDKEAAINEHCQVSVTSESNVVTDAEVATEISSTRSGDDQRLSTSNDDVVPTPVKEIVAETSSSVAEDKVTNDGSDDCCVITHVTPIVEDASCETNSQDDDDEDDSSYDDSTYSSSDEDEEYGEGDDDGAFPVAERSSQGENGEEMDDFSENDSPGQALAAANAIPTRSKRQVSPRVYDSSKHIASGSFCPGPERYQPDASDDVDFVPNMDDHVVVEVDELQSDHEQEEERRRRFQSIQVWNAVAMGIFLRTFRRRKKRTEC